MGLSLLNNCVCPSAAISKESIVSDQHIWILHSLLINIFGDELKRQQQQRINRNSNRVVEGCVLNFWDELNVM